MARFLVLFLLLYSNTQAQYYRLSYTPASLPELYNTIHLQLEHVNADSTVTPVRGNYRLIPHHGNIKKSEYTFNYYDLYENDGKLTFDVIHAGDTSTVVLGLPIMTGLRFNLYTDSIKPVMNYYINVEGTFSNGKTFPVDTAFLRLSCSSGSMQGMEWRKPAKITFDKVTFTAISKYAPVLAIDTTLYLRKEYEE
ncbi:MAG: hypothetical protein H6551_08100 [Chitinophagales bacterium]|nr:hypothetical protein [Chitinophagaceae bacterium]MCB9065084.1 hypothetical protein [Chitinophagales bacterium]